MQSDLASTSNTDNLANRKFDADFLLIAASHNINVVLSNEISLDFGGFASVDDVVFHGKFSSPESGEKCLGLMQTVQTVKPPVEIVKRTPNAFRYLWAFDFGVTSARVGIGWNKSNNKVDMARFKVQYNPNKIGNSIPLKMLLDKISRFIRSVELKRYDMAIDIPVNRFDCRMIKDRRNYEFFHGKTSITEYLGSRSKAGRVKLYDKTAELEESQGVQVEGDWSRLELTCDGSWSVEQIQEHLPKVITKADEGMTESKKTIWALTKSLALNIEHGEPIDEILTVLDYRTRNKVVQFLEAPNIEIDSKAIQHVIDSAHAELKRFGIE